MDMISQVTDRLNDIVHGARLLSEKLTIGPVSTAGETLIIFLAGPVDLRTKARELDYTIQERRRR